MFGFQFKTKTKKILGKPSEFLARIYYTNCSLKKNITVHLLIKGHKIRKFVNFDKVKQEW